METITIVVDDGMHCFVVERELLVNSGDYFKRVLDGSFKDVTDNTLMYPTITRTAFQDFVIWLSVPTYRPNNVARAFELFGLLQQFSINNCPLTEFISLMEHVKIKELVSYVTKLTPEFDDDLINAIAKHVRYGDDLSGFSDEFSEAITSSPMKRVYGEGLTRDIVLYLERLAVVPNASKKRYIVSDPNNDYTIIPRLFEAVNLADLFLQLRDWFLIEGNGGNYKSNSLSTEFSIHDTLDARKKLTKIEPELTAVTEELFVDINRSCVVKDDKRYMFKELPVYRSRLSVVEGVLVSLHPKEVIGLCDKTDTPDFYRVTKLRPKYISLLPLDPKTSFTHEEDEEESEAYDILPIHIFSESNLTVAEIFALTPNPDDVILNLFGSFIAHEF